MSSLSFVACMHFRTFSVISTPGRHVIHQRQVPLLWAATLVCWMGKLFTSWHSWRGGVAGLTSLARSPTVHAVPTVDGSGCCSICQCMQYSIGLGIIEALWSRRG